MTDRKLTDWRGTVYGVGDKVLWATAQSSSLTMHEGIVEAKHSWRDETSTKLKVRPTHQATSYGDSKLNQEFVKIVTLSVLSRVTALETA